MRAGELTERVIIERPVEEVSPSGTKRTTWSASEPWSAQLVRQRGARLDEAGEHFANNTATFLLRASAPVQENWRLRHIGGYHYVIVAVELNRRKGFNTLNCERLNG